MLRNTLFFSFLNELNSFQNKFISTETDSVGTAIRISHGQLGMLYELRCLLPDVGKPITWFKNGQPLRPDPSNRITFRNRNWVVLFNPLQPVDAGYYMCRYRDNSMSYSTAIRVAGAPQSGGWIDLYCLSSRCKL